MPASNVKKNKFTYVCVLDNFKLIGQNGSQVAAQVMCKRLFSSKPNKSEKCVFMYSTCIELHFLKIILFQMPAQTSVLLFAQNQ